MRNVRFVVQQAAIFIAVICLSLLYSHSFATVSQYTQENGVAWSKSVSYSFDVLSNEAAFENTETFDRMLMDTLRDIIRYNILKGQMEEDGVFAGSKEINIKAYVNRKDTALEEEESGDICYKLEDLLKWSQYGVSDITKEYTETEFIYAFCNTQGEINKLTNQIDKDYENLMNEGQRSILLAHSGDSNRLSLYLDEINQEAIICNKKGEICRESKKLQYLADILPELNGAVNEIFVDESTGELHIVVIELQERYYPVSTNKKKGSLMDHVDSWQEYNGYCADILAAISDISYNYEEYREFSERLGDGKTNVFYDFNLTLMGNQMEISNFSEEEYPKEQFEKYLAYEPQSLQLTTNTTGYIEVEDIFNVLKQYEYAYPETASIFIGLDNSYPVNDAFSNASRAYDFLYRYKYILFVGIGLGILIWFVQLLYLSVNTQKTSAGEELIWFDKIPSEIFILIAVGFGILTNVAVKFMIPLWSDNDYIVKNRFTLAVITGCIELLISIVFCVLWYSLIRRFKNRIFWKNSACYVVVEHLRKWGIVVYNNAPSVIRAIVTAGFIIILNFLGGIRFLFAFPRFSCIWVLLLLLALDAIIISIWIDTQIKRKRIVEGLQRIKEGDHTYQIPTDDLHGENRKVANAVNSIGEGIHQAVEASMKDERLKADLITNVSHDIKTPLTSIINYVDLLKREKIETEPVKGYIEVLDGKTQRLKQLTEDLVEASKISSGNITLYMEKINLSELVMQTIGEFSEKFEEKNLQVVDGFSQVPVYITADSRRIFRVVENLFSNIYKYAMPGTRVYLDRKVFDTGYVSLTIKNISAQPLNIDASELTERFIRGDVSRSTEGSGLGLSIAKNLTELQGGYFDIFLDGDLFRVTLTFPVYREPENAPNYSQTLDNV